MDPTFERFLNGIRQFLKEARSGELSNEDEEYLRILTDTKKHLVNLQETGECDHTATLKNVCQAVLYGNYIIVKNNFVVFSQKVNEVKEAESKGVPKILQPGIRQIKDYVAILSELIKNMDNLAKMILNKVNFFFERDSKLTEEEGIEVECLNIGFQTVVKQTTDCFNQADRELKMFESDVVSYKMDHRKSKAQLMYEGLTLLLNVAIGSVVGGVFGTVTGAVGGGSISDFATDYIYSDPCKNLETKCEELNSKLRSLDMERKEPIKDHDGVVEKANVLQVIMLTELNKDGLYYKRKLIT